VAWFEKENASDLVQLYFCRYTKALCCGKLTRFICFCIWWQSCTSRI